MSEVKQDWRTLPAGRALDRVIAERLGLDIRYVPKVEEYLVREDEIPSFLHEYADYDYPQPGWCLVPYYSMDANAALSLLDDDEGTEYMLRKLNTGWHIHAYFKGSSTKTTATAETIALVICRAFLTWTEGAK